MKYCFAFGVSFACLLAATMTCRAALDLGGDLRMAPASVGPIRSVPSRDQGADLPDDFAAIPVFAKSIGTSGFEAAPIPPQLVKNPFVPSGAPKDAEGQR
jgi:hypothetical protein